MAKKSMALALILSIIYPGLGLIYDGETGKGLIYLIIQILLTIANVYLYITGLMAVEEMATTVTVVFYTSIIVWVISLYDTFATTRMINIKNI